MKKFYAILALVCLTLAANAQKHTGYKVNPVKMEQIKGLRSTVNGQLKKAVNRPMLKGHGLKIQKAEAFGQKMHSKSLLATDNLDIVATTLSLSDWGWLVGKSLLEFEAYNSNYYVDLYVYTENPVGTFSEKDFDLEDSHIADQEGEYAIEKANITVGEDDVYYTVKGTVVCDNGKSYNLNLSYVKPTKTRSESITVTDGEWGDYRYYDGTVGAEGYNEKKDRYLSLYVYCDDLAGTFTSEDFDYYYTSIYEIFGTDTLEYGFVDGNATATIDGDYITYTGTLLLQGYDNPEDVPEYTFSITAKMEEPTPEGENQLTNGGFEEWTDETTPTGWEGWQITEQGNTGSAELSQSTDAHSGEYACLVKGASSNKRLSTGKLTLDAGTYYVTFYAKAATEGAAVKYGYATLQANGSAQYNYDRDENNQDSKANLGDDWQKVSYSFTLTEKTDLAIIIMNVKNSGDCLIDDVTLVKDENGGGEEDEPLQYDEDSDFYCDFTEEVTVDDEYLEKYGLLYLEAYQGDKYVLLEFNVDSSDPTIVIPEGTYPINYTEEPGTVTASKGVDEDFYLTGSFASTLSEYEGEMYPDKVWFLVDGTVTISNVDGNIKAVVSGVNSYGRKISMTIIGGGAPVPPIDDKVVAYSIDFTQTTEGWTIDDKNLSEGMEYVWKQDSKYGMKASAYVNKTNMPAESWIISPEIDLTTIGNAVLSFSHAVNFCAEPSKALTVLVSENGTDWTELEIDNWPAGKDWNFVDATASLANYAEKKIQIAFKYTSTDKEAATWEIKNLSVTGNGIYDSIEAVAVNGQQSTVNSIFNLAGQKVGNDYKGIVIVNGKKYLK